MTLTEFEAEVFGVMPAQVMEYVVFAVKLPVETPTLFDVAPPVEKPVPVQLVASVEDHVIVVAVPYGISASATLIETEGLETLTVRFEVAEAPSTVRVHVI